MISKIASKVVSTVAPIVSEVISKAGAAKPADKAGTTAQQPGGQKPVDSMTSSPVKKLMDLTGISSKASQIPGGNSTAVPDQLLKAGMKTIAG